MYKRYVIFEWDKYDNADPIPDYESSFDDFDEAIFVAIDRLSSWSFSAILDMESREIIKKLCQYNIKDEYVPLGYEAVLKAS